MKNETVFSGHSQGSRDAVRRIAAYVRRTPLIPAFPWDAGARGASLWFKPECLQVTGSFKARGACNRILSLSEDERRREIVTASGGNFGAAIAYAAHRLHVKASVFVMTTSTDLTRARIRRHGLEPRITGAFWDQSWAAAQRYAEERQAVLVHPYADRDVISGQGTVAHEILEDLPQTETIVAAIGGGGLIAGLAEAAKQIKPSIRIVGVEAAGCPTLKTCREKGRIVVLDQVETRVPILASRSTEPINFALIERHVDEVLVVDESLIGPAAHEVWNHTGLAIELGAATAVAAVQNQLFAMRPDETVVVVLCGGGTDGIGI